ncbi:MAG: single-stranded-DNA-specific exonuclease RecJ [Rhodobiaceae bacterium]|nr:single-stranded-DNA-specific exonuclease RecJ [Rhodobiaceae bacterium]
MAIAQQLDLPELLGRVLAARGVAPDDAARFLDPNLRDLLPDPSSLTDMDKAARRLAEAVAGGERIAIFGDYDVDGASSSALLARFLRAVGSDAEIYIPDRIFEGYGPNVAALEGIKERGARLVVCVDCGTGSHEALGWAASAGLDVVVLDHHQTGSDLPPVVALVNANRQDDLSGAGALAAVGITFLAIIAVNRELRARGWYGGNRREPDLLAWLDLVALGTVCDVVPLTGLNRAFVAKGLIVARHRQNPGLRALADAAGLKSPPDAGSLGYALGPRINAGGRIGRADLGARLLSESDPAEAARLAATLDKLNSERQHIEQATVEEALGEAEASLGARHEEPFVLVEGEGWHPGVVGLVATRLKDRFHRPAFAIAFDAKGMGTGSARSVPGVDLGAAVRAAVERGVLVKGGGHAMAAGLTVERGQLGALRAFLHEKLLEPVGAAHEIDWVRIDGALTAGAATPALIELMARAGPFGAGNPEPCFAFPRHRVQFAKIVGKGHVRCTLAAADGSRIGAIAFRAAAGPLGEFLLAARGEPVHAAGFLRLSHWGGRTSCELHLTDAAQVVIPD